MSTRTRIRAHHRRGFTLIETALGTVIIGVGVVAIVEAQQSFLRTTRWSSQAATATYLANEIREMTRNLPNHDPVTGLFFLDDGEGGQDLEGWGPDAGEVELTDFDDLDDFDGWIIGQDGDWEGPINAFGETIPMIDQNGNVVLDNEGNVVPLTGWRVILTVEKVDPRDYSLVRDDNDFDPPVGEVAGIAVDEFPVRVTAEVQQQDPTNDGWMSITAVQWVSP